MTRAVLALVTLTALTVLAHAQDDVDTVPTDGHPMGIPGAYCGTAHPHASAALRDPAGLTSSVIYVNRCTGGCTYTGALEHDAATNKVAIRGTAVGTTYTFPEFTNFADQTGTAADAEFDAVVSCIRKVYSYYNTQVVTTRPASGTYHVMNIAGAGVNLGQAPDGGGGVLLGISDVRCTGAIDNMTSFTFAESHKVGSISTDAADYVKNLCVTAVHEAGHSYGLEHEFNFVDGTSACNDPMSYDIGKCDPPYRFFRNKLASCGGFEEMPCVCSSGSQNSHVRLFTLFGKGTPSIATANVAVTTPVADGMVASRIIGGMGSERGFDKVELYINNFKWDTLPGAVFAIGGGQPNPAVYNFPVPDTLPDSKVDIFLRGIDDLGNAVDSPVVTAVKGAPCATAETCAEGQKCEDGKCFWDPPVGEVGDACAYNEYCTTGMCKGDICTRECIVEASDSCPPDLECRVIENEKICALPEGGGCCSTSDQRVPWLTGLLTAVLGILLLRRRRTAHA